MIYFCLAPSSQPSSRCIINVENPPSPHVLLRHEDGDFDLSCRLLIRMCCGGFFCFVSHRLSSILRISTVLQTRSWQALCANGCFHFLHCGVIREQANSMQIFILSVSFYTTAGDGPDPTSRVLHAFLHQALSSAALSPTHTVYKICTNDC